MEKIGKGQLVICGLYDISAVPREVGGKIEDDDKLVVFTRENWLKFQIVIDETGTRAAFKDAGVFMCPINSKGILNHEDVMVRSSVLKRD